MLVKLVKVVNRGNFGAVGDSSIKGNVGKIVKTGKVSIINFGAVGDSSDKDNAGKVNNFGAVGDEDLFSHAKKYYYNIIY